MPRPNCPGTDPRFAPTGPKKGTLGQLAATHKIRAQHSAIGTAAAGPDPHRFQQFGKQQPRIPTAAQPSQYPSRRGNKCPSLRKGANHPLPDLPRHGLERHKFFIIFPLNSTFLPGSINESSTRPPFGTSPWLSPEWALELRRAPGFPSPLTKQSVACGEKDQATAYSNEVAPRETPMGGIIPSP